MNKTLESIISEKKLRDFSKKYLTLLLNEYKTINLTRIIDESDFYIKQIFDSVISVEKSIKFYNDLTSSSLVVDVGFSDSTFLIGNCNNFSHLQTPFKVKKCEQTI